MLKKAILPPEFIKSIYGREFLPRVANFSGLVSLDVRDLFPDIPEEIYLRGNDLSPVRKAAEDALADVKMDMIQPNDTVNILCCEHAFSILEGESYAEILRTIKKIVKERTGCGNIRLRVAIGGGAREAEEIVKHYKFDQYFDGRVARVGPFDRGIPIETEIGTLYGVARAYDADWFVHAHYDDPREVYLHRVIDRALKPFGMGYARFETRSVFHTNFGNRSANFIPRAIFNSPFIQQKYAFSCIQMSSPAGIIGVVAGNDVRQLNRRLIISVLRSYGKMLRLFAEIDECIVALDGGKWPWYIHAAGLTSGNLFKGPLDFLDLEVGSSHQKIDAAINPSIKALIVNNTWTALFWDLELRVPTIIVDPNASDPPFLKDAKTAKDIESAMELAIRIADTDKIIVFDGSFGSINLSPSLAEFMLKKAPEISRKVDEELLPKWLRQRGIDPEEVLP